MASITFPQIPDNLPLLVQERFSAAKASKSLTYTPTEISLIHAEGIPFQLRFSPALAQKPKAEKPQHDGTKPSDPFADSPEALVITELPPSHFLVLNKFAIVPEHFILATKAYKQQTHLLEEGDLSAAYACVSAWNGHGNGLFAFFNSGEHSGASQPHRHLQFIPVDSMLEGMEDQEWRPLADSLASSSKSDLPIAYFAATLPTSPAPSQLHKMYLELHSKACDAVQRHQKTPPLENTQGGVHPDGSSIISYNLAMTNKSMMLVPRLAEGKTIRGSIDGIQTLGLIALNGTLLAGTLLVKNKWEWECLSHDEYQLFEILSAIGVPRASEPQGKI